MADSLYASTLDVRTPEHPDARTADSTDAGARGSPHAGLTGSQQADLTGSQHAGLVESQDGVMASPVTVRVIVDVNSILLIAVFCYKDIVQAMLDTLA